MINVTFFTRKDCHLCKDVEKDLSELQNKYPHQLNIVDIDTSPDLIKEYGFDIPVIQTGPYTLKSPFDIKDMEVTLGAASDRQLQLEEIGDEKFIKRKDRASRINGGDKFSMWFSNHYMLVFNLFIVVYVGLPILAPVLLKIGAETPAALIYKLYGGLCHQLSYRSFFLFGEQPIYPRALAGIEGFLTFHQATGLDEHGLVAARNFLGNEGVGFKIALCQRDIAIYLAILFFGILFVVSRKKIRPLPFWAWILFGIAPIGFDGVSQFVSQIIAEPALSSFQTFFSFLPLRESTPFLRTLTGSLFGFTTAWFGYPLVEQAMEETRRLMLVKFSRLGET